MGFFPPGYLSQFTPLSRPDGQEERPVVSGHQKHSVGHEEVPHGPDPDARPVALLLHGRPRSSQVHHGRLLHTGVCKQDDRGVNNELKYVREKENYLLSCITGTYLCFRLDLVI